MALYCTVILSEMDGSLGERSMQSKAPTIAGAIDCCAGNSHDAEVRMPFWACARAKGYGVLRLRGTIREANRAAALRMTENCGSPKLTLSSFSYQHGSRPPRMEEERADVER